MRQMALLGPLLFPYPNYSFLKVGDFYVKVDQWNRFLKPVYATTQDEDFHSTMEWLEKILKVQTRIVSSLKMAAYTLSICILLYFEFSVRKCIFRKFDQNN